MEYIPINCPHCEVKNVSFTIINTLSYDTGLKQNVFAICNICFNPVAIRARVHHAFRDMAGKDLVAAYFKDSVPIDFDVWPKPEEPACPAHCPADVERSFLQGLAAVKASPDGAVVLMRRCLEQSIKHIHANGKGTLYKRIEAAHEAGHLTKSLKDWAHHIRLIGNDAAHDAAEEADEAEIKNLVDFTRLVLTYLFTLPGEVAAKIPAEATEAGGA